MRCRELTLHRWQMMTIGILLAVASGCKFGTPDQLVRRDHEGQVERGKTLVFAFGCVACHEISGLSGSPGHIGPPLTSWSRRKYIAGQLPNERRMLVRWIVGPQEVEPGTAMPDLGVTEPEARDMAAYLYSQ